MPKAQSSSSLQTKGKANLGITRHWATGFAAYLEEFQAEWNSLQPDEVQQFLRDRRDGLIAWHAESNIMKPLPEKGEIKIVRPRHLRFSSNLLTATVSILPAIIRHDSLRA